MTDETMITRVARAMQTRRHELIAQPLSRIWDELAKVAVEAMREPTSVMVDAGANLEVITTADGWKEVGAGEYVAGAIFRNMIDAALEDDGKTTQSPARSSTLYADTAAKEDAYDFVLKLLDDSRRASLPKASGALDATIRHLRRNGAMFPSDRKSLREKGPRA